MIKKIFILIALAVIVRFLIVPAFFRPSGRSLVLDEFGIDKTKFPYVMWKNFRNEFQTEIAEVIDYRTLRSRDGHILLLCAVGKPIERDKTVAFLKKKVLGKKVTVLVCSGSTDYSGLVYAVVFYGSPAKCLNKILYDKGLVDVVIENRFFKKDLWFNAETD
ncbi:MAG: hypothetical protein J7L54_00850 [Elusimicrobia bacterium]|nr:hypothetical protein [Elusimicrobiota bacterium]